MAEGREYISHADELGEISISEDVLATIAAAAALDTEGVCALGAGIGSDLSNPAARKNLTKAIRLEVAEDQVVVDIVLLVAYGYSVTDVAKAVQDAVMTAVENTSGLHVAGVNVAVTGVSFQK
jgi:uncharacterized alkaline shock family protein YloU